MLDDRCRIHPSYCQRLRTAALTQFLNAPTARFDVIVLADTLCYFGDLTAVIAAARKALRANGQFLFALERTADDSGSYQIQVLGRYSHGRAHIERALTDNVFSSVVMTPVLLRYEAGQEVNGRLVDAQV